VARPTSVRVSTAAQRIGEQLVTWRKLQGLTAQSLAERAGMARDTLRRVEKGDPGVSFEAFLNVTRALGVLDAVVASTDPYETELGRARADEVLPQRVRP